MSIHTCSYYCERPECIRAQRDELRQKLEQAEKQEPVAIGEEWKPCVKLPVVVHVREQRKGETHVSTREGITPVKEDDLIMRGVAGEEYPIGRELFNRTYTFDTAPVHAIDISQERVDETAKDRHEPESNNVEAAAEQSDNYAAFLAGVRFARVNLPAPQNREHELAGTMPISNGGVATRTPSSFISPPKREWVELTDEEWVKELGKVREQVNGDVFGGFYRAIEAKLKEKNHDTR
jgi:hypothetical protein